MQHEPEILTPSTDRPLADRGTSAAIECDRLFDYAVDVICICDAGGRIERANPALERTLGVAAADVVGRRLAELVDERDRACFVQAVVDALAAGAPVELENRCTHADASPRWLVWRITPAADERRVYAFAHDVTGRRRVEQALRAEHAFRKAMDDSMLTGMRAIDMDGRIIFVNKAFCKMVGYAPEDLLGCRPPMPYWAPEETASAMAVYETTLAGVAPASGSELRFKKKTGERFDVIWYVSPLVDDTGRQTGWMASMNDISEHKRAREALRTSHERFVAVLDGLDAAVSVRDLDSYELLYVNDSFRRIFADAAATDLYCQLSPWQPSGDPQDAHALLLDDDGDPRGIVDAEMQHAGNGRWYHVRSRAIKWVDGRLVGLEIATDVTDRHEAEELNRQQLERLQLTSRLITMGEMASSLAHELNQPLSAISNYVMGCVKRLRGESPNRDEILRAMEKASTQAQRAGKIIRRIRDFVQKSEPKRSAIDVNEIVEESAGFTEFDARAKNVSVVLDLMPELPPACADRIMVEQVLLNLVKNGIEAMQDVPAGERELWITTQVNTDGMIEVAVADRGHGVPEDLADKLFTPFFSTKSAGMGMGLNICRSIVEYHNGRLWVEPNPGRGAVFRFTLPGAA